LLLLLFVLYLYLIPKLDTRQLYDKECLTYRSQTGLQHLLQKKVNTEYFTSEKLRDIFNIGMHIHTTVVHQ